MAGQLEDPLRIIALPCTAYTREVGIAVRVSSDASRLTRIPIIGDTYRSAAICKTRLPEFGDFICTDIQGSGDYIDVFFSKNKTTAEALTAFKPPTTKTGNLYWPPMLLDVEVRELKVPRTANTGDQIISGKSYEAIPVWIPSADTGTLFTMYQSIMPTEPVIAQAPTYQTRSVSFPLPGGRAFSFGENIGPEINIRVMQDTYQSYDVVAETIGSNVGAIGPFTFKATDPKFWTTYELYRRSNKLATGAYIMEWMMVTPPPTPPRIRGFR